MRLSVTFLNKSMGFDCFCRLLDVGRGRVRKAKTATVDMRLGKDKKQSRARTYSVDAFLGVLYNGVGETLPDRCPD